MNSASIKRSVNDTSIDLDKSTDEDLNKKLKMSKSEEIAILILDGGSEYINQPAKLKENLDNLNLSQAIKETKITVSNHLIIIFNDLTGRDMFMAKSNNFKKNIKIIDLNKKKKIEIVIKGLNFKTLGEYGFELSQLGITKLAQMNKSNENYKMVRADCDSEETREKLTQYGLKLDYFSLKVENYIRPIRPLQCFNCQQFDHMASGCPNKIKPVCLKCSGGHNSNDCECEEIKCANCSDDHKSNSQECEIFKQKLNEKLQNTNKNSRPSSTTIRKYSQISNYKQDFDDMKSSILDSITVVNESIQEQIKADKESLQASIKKVEDEVNTQKIKQLYIDMDKMRLLNAAYTDDHIRNLHKIYKFHGIDFKLENALSYNKQGGYNSKKKETKPSEYV